jgi:hypothetical protein
MEANAKAGTEAQQGAGVLGDVGLVQGKFDGNLPFLLRVGTPSVRV